MKRWIKVAVFCTGNLVDSDPVIIPYMDYYLVWYNLWIIIRERGISFNIYC